MATPGAQTAAAQPPVAATNYKARYHNQRDAFNGQYSALYKPYHPVNGLSKEALFETVVTSAQNIPKVFLAQVEIDNDFCVIAVHRPSRYEQDMTRISHTWDDKVFAFIGDIRAGSHFIRTVTLPDDCFEVTEPQRVTVHANMDAKWKADYNVDILEPVPQNEAGSTSITTRRLIPVPAAYVSLVLGKTFSTREAWSVLTTALVHDSRELACVQLVDWLRVASFRRKKGSAPATCLGDINTVFPNVPADEQLDRHRWNILTRDMPALNRATTVSNVGGITDQHFVKFLSTMRSDRAQERAQEEARRVADKQDKLPSATKYKVVAREWMTFCSVTNEEHLPAIYHEIVNSDKAEHLTILRNAVKARARSSDAATDQTPVVSKETKEMVLSARFGVEPHQAHDLTLGLQPFSMGLFVGNELSKTVELRATGYETMLQGLAAPTLGEQATFNTKEIRLPQHPFTAGLMLTSTSVQLDVLQGKNHPCAIAYRYFCTKQWPTIATTLHLSSRYNPALSQSVLPRILRWIQTHLVCYFHQLMTNDGNPVPLPPFADLQNMISLQQFNLLPDLPDAYRLLPSPAPAPAAPTDTKPAAKPTEQTKRDSTTPDSSNAGRTTTSNRGGALVTNPTISSALKDKLEASTKRICDFQSHAPNSTNTSNEGKPIPICLSYHMRGHCFSNCNRVATHRPLSDAEASALATMAQQHLE